ncbi:hypothetical protein EBR25_01050 [bacterium]|nr:hypothetical protein [bacterium]
MTRIPENFISTSLLADMLKNKAQVAKYSSELSTGYKVSEPGDSSYASTISQMRGTLVEIEGQKSRVSTATGYLERQEAIFEQFNDILIRANEIAAQAANETNSEVERSQLAQEVYEIRNQVVGLANSTYLGKYVFAGGADDTPAYDTGYAASQFTTPSSGQENAVIAYSTNTDSSLVRSVPVTNDLSVQVNATGPAIFDDAIRGLTQLGRALSGFKTEWTSTNPPVPNNTTSVAYTFPTEYTQQTQDIQTAMDLIERAREQDVIPAQTAVAGRMRRLQAASSLLELSEASAKGVLSNLQEADVIESATRLSEAQTALNASLTVTTQLLNQSILDYL